MLDDVQVAESHVWRQNHEPDPGRQQTDRCLARARRRRSPGQMKGVISRPGSIPEQSQVGDHDEAECREGGPGFENLTSEEEERGDSEPHQGEIYPEELAAPVGRAGIEVADSRC